MGMGEQEIRKNCDLGGWIGRGVAVKASLGLGDWQGFFWVGGVFFCAAILAQGGIYWE